MRAEEMNVVDAAIALYRAEQTRSTLTSSAVAENDLRQATKNLIFSCPQCNTGTHTCPGCGTDVGHFEFACDQCDFEFACGQCEDDSTSAVVNTAECTCPPGPEDAHFSDCPMYIQSECRCSRTEKMYCAADGCHGGADLVQEPVEPEPEWTPAEWQHVLAGDRVRLGTQEADVTRSNVGVWHTDNSNRYQPRPWEHAEVSVSLAHLDRPLVMAPGGPVEILAGRERAAVLVIQKAFPAVAA